MVYRRAASIGIGVKSDPNYTVDMIQVLMTDSEGSEDVWQFVMSPVEARRHAMRILQACEQAEGRQGVNT